MPKLSDNALNDLSSRANYVHFHFLQTRWMDNDIYGHVNNVTYYSYFDTAANQYLIDQGGLDIQSDDIVGFVVASNCQYLAPVSHPSELDIGLRINKLGNRSVEYGMAVFKHGQTRACAYGSFTHVFVQRSLNTSISIPQSIRSALEKIA